MSPFEIVFAQIATQIFVLVGQTAVALLMTLVVFGISCEGSIGIVIVVTLLQGVAGMCYGKQCHGSMETLYQYVSIIFNEVIINVLI